jgi:hypothetical protein
MDELSNSNIHYLGTPPEKDEIQLQYGYLESFASWVFWCDTASHRSYV